MQVQGSPLKQPTAACERRDPYYGHFNKFPNSNPTRAGPKPPISSQKTVTSHILGVQVVGSLTVSFGIIVSMS